MRDKNNPFEQVSLETNIKAAQMLIDNCSQDLDGSRFVQTAEGIMSQQERFDRINKVMESDLEALESQLKLRKLK